MSDYRIHIPSPCSENFSKMKKDEKGRYCAMCAKHVIDFSKKSNEEIIEIIKEKKEGEICGTFHQQQLEPQPEIKKRRKLFSIEFLNVALVVFITNSFFACRVYKRTGGPIMFDTTGNGSGSAKMQTLQEHVSNITSTCPPEDQLLGGSVVVTQVKPHFPNDKDSAFLKKDTVIISDKSLSDTTYIHFPSNRYELSKEERAALTAFAKKLKTTPDLVVNISGYADGTGSENTNKDVSQRRAEVVRTYLRQLKVSNTINIFAYGNKNPVASNTTEEGKAKNRRVELYISE